MIQDEGNYKCDFCGGETGDFLDETGNHLPCEQLHLLREKAREVVEQYRVDVHHKGMDVTAEMNQCVNKLAALLNETEQV
jgi:hypothetical protein